MKTFVSPIYIQTNQYASEKIVCGLLAVDNNKIYFKVSDDKLELASKLIETNIKPLAKNAFELIVNKVKDTNNKYQEKQISLFDIKHNFNSDYIQYLSKYSSGIIQFNDPKPYNTDLNQEKFLELFKKFVGDNLIEKPVVQKDFLNKVKRALSKPHLKEKADINYQLDPHVFAGLLKQASVSLITSNGAVNIYQSVDFHASESTIVSKLYEFDAIQNSVTNFAKEHLKLTTKASLIAEKSDDLEKDQKELFDNVYNLKVKTKAVDLISPDQLEEVTSDIISTPHKRISTVVEKIEL